MKELSFNTINYHLTLNLTQNIHTHKFLDILPLKCYLIYKWGFVHKILAVANSQLLNIKPFLCAKCNIILTSEGCVSIYCLQTPIMKVVCAGWILRTSY